MVGGQVQSVIADATASTDEVLVLTPSQAIIADVIAVLRERNQVERVQLLSHEDVLRAVLSEFVLASQVAELHAADRLSLRRTTRTPENSLLISEDSVTAVVAGVEDCVGLRAVTPPAVEPVRQRHQQYWADATPTEPETLPVSELRTTLQEQVGTAVGEDFIEIVHAATPAREEPTLGGVAISLLAAANNEALLYDLSRWGENTGLASKATFSRTKAQLEDSGIVTAEKVPVDVGRPRLRLCRAADQPADPIALAEHARRQLA